MNTLTITVEDKRILPSLRKVLSSISGVSILRQPKAKTKKLSAYEMAMDDIKHNRISTYANSQELFDELGI